MSNLQHHPSGAPEALSMGDKVLVVSGEPFVFGCMGAVVQLFVSHEYNTPALARVTFTPTSFEVLLPVTSLRKLSGAGRERTLQTPPGSFLSIPTSQTISKEK
ncbi:MAG TPA: hypothetical protein DCE42_30175 [Myxococcales bacterium]|nr:hypothetical protein [Myxococcales bacterium]